jgi:hemolysin III
MIARVTEAEIHEPLKPHWRGLLHHIFVFVSLGASAVLVVLANSTKAAITGLIYGLSLVAMYSISAAYHRGTWSTAGRDRMRKLDHAGIFFLIAGSYVPVAALGVPGWAGTILLWGAVLGGVVGVLHSVFFVHLFRGFNIILYVAFGCMAVPFLPQLLQGLGLTNTLFIVAGGVCYIVGAVVYGKKWPNPSPVHFGYHEIFHALVVLASALHFVAVLRLVRAAA